MRLRWITFNFFLENKISLAIFIVPGLKYKFRWWANLVISSRSLFNFWVVLLKFLTTENWDVSSASNLGKQETSQGRLFTWIRKNSQPKIDLWETQVVILFQLEVCPFNTTLWYLSDKKLPISFNNLPVMPLRLYNNPSCQNLSKDFEISRKTLYTSRDGL